MIFFNGESNMQTPWPEEHLLPPQSRQGLRLRLLLSLKRFLCARARGALLHKSKTVQRYDFTNTLKLGHFQARRELRAHFIRPFMYMYTYTYALQLLRLGYVCRSVLI